MMRRIYAMLSVFAVVVLLSPVVHSQALHDLTADDYGRAEDMLRTSTLQAAVYELESEGVTGIAVVRLFVSSESFRHESEFAFRLRDDEPASLVDGNPPRQLDLNVPASTNKEGLLDATFVGHVLATRASRLISYPASESVTIIGHGPGDDIENESWLERMDLLAEPIRRIAPFHSVRVFTLRDDRAEKRERVEQELRKLLVAEADSGRNVLVIPFRLSGFGPYAEVLDGLPYRADSMGILPDPRVSSWIRNQFESQFQCVSDREDCLTSKTNEE